jgi:hypothetical protein
MLRRLRDAALLSFALANGHHLAVALARYVEMRRRLDYPG